MYGKEYLDAKNKAEAIKRAVEAVDAILSEYEDIDAREAIAMRICPGIDVAKDEYIANKLAAEQAWIRREMNHARNQFPGTVQFLPATPTPNVTPLLGNWWPFR